MPLDPDLTSGIVEPEDNIDLSAGIVAPRPTESHLTGLQTFAKEHGLRITSTTGGKHNEGSLHYSGNAMDVDPNGVDVNALSQAAAAKGFKVRDERTRPAGQKEWHGSHIHIEYSDGIDLSSGIESQPSQTSLNSSQQNDLVESRGPAGVDSGMTSSSTPTSTTANSFYGIAKRRAQQGTTAPAPRGFISGFLKTHQAIEQSKAATQQASRYDVTKILKQATDNYVRTPQQEEAQRIASEAPTSFVGRLIPAEMNRFAAKAERAIAGLADYAEMLPHPGRGEGPSLTRQISDYLKNRSVIAEQASQYETADVENSLPKQVVKAIADTGVDVGSLIALTQVSGLPFPVVMAGEAALNSSDKSKYQIAKDTATAYGLGLAYQYIPGKIASKLGVTGQVGTRAVGAGLFGTAGATQTALEGGSPKEIIAQGIAQAGMGALGGPEEKRAKVNEPITMTPRTKAETEPALGPGAANIGDIPIESTTKQLAEAIKNAEVTPRDKIDYAINLADKLTAGRDLVERGIEKSKAISQSLWSKYKGATDVADSQKILGDFQYKLQKSAFETRKFAKELDRTLSPAQQEDITNHIQADGDINTLKERAAKSSGSTKASYERAVKLTDEEKTIANHFSSAFDSLFKEANDAGVKVSFIENYVPQIWGERTKASRAMLSDAQRGMLDPTFKFSKKRVFESYFEGEQAGYRPKTKSIGALYQIYSNALNKAIASRQYIADLKNTEASDGRPLVAIRGAGQTPMTEGSLPQEKGAFIKPHAKTANTSDYRVINHPAMRGWKYTTSIDGKPVMLEGDMAIHPEAYRKIKNVLTPSKIATGEGPAYSALRFVKKGQSIAKQTMLGFFSPFHQVQEDVHALGHQTLPYVNKTKIDFDDPKQQRLVKGGLQVASWHDAEAFSEGLSGGNLTARIPVIGTKLLGPYQDWLFKSHIPNLKMNMALHALERNTKRYQGKLSPERIAELTASQANNAFGELNYAYLGRNQTFQDSLRMLLLAPDFLEARAKFAGSALKGQGREQLNAILLLAATQYVTARVLNKLSDDDYHLEPENAFVVVHKGKTYGLRSVPSDILELAEDPRKFLTHRSSPLTAAAIRAYTGKNEFGSPVDLMEQAKLLAQSPVPIQLKGAFYKKEMNLWDSFFSSMGIRVGKTAKLKKKEQPNQPKKRGRLIF